ncbi:MAG: dihydrolipoyl dehydrogenase, partial [Candidatus Margulisiibacteriota bacterium]
MDKFDVIVIGGGPGGYVAAIRAAQLGAKVALIEKDQLGGTCLNHGCIPTKAILACTSLFDKIKKADNFGITTENTKIDLPKVIDRKNEIVKKLIKGIEMLVEKNKITLIRGDATVISPTVVEVATQDSRKLTIESRKLVLATGSSPSSLPGITFDGNKFLSSDDILNLREAPSKLDIVGGGIIGIHFAIIFASLGTEVTIYEALPEILPGVDEEIVATLKRILKRRKIEVKTGVFFKAEDSCGKTLICVGRKPNLAGIEKMGLKMDGNKVWTNEKMETSVPGVYAIGDLVSHKQLAHVASEQGVAAAENAMGGNKTFSYASVPYGIYTNPEIGSVGLTEKEAREKHSNIKVGKFPFGALGIAQATGEIEGFFKIISDE